MRISNIMAATAVAFLLVVALAIPAEARTHHHHYSRHHYSVVAKGVIVCVRFGCHEAIATRTSASRPQYTRAAAVDATGSDPRPGAWCAWWLRRHMGIPRSAFPPYQYNLARAFAGLGTPAPRGCTGCVAVFARGRGGHVGLVERWDANGNPVILSGNVNGGVATMAHPASRLIALRWVS